jgi:hypothetical protein
MPVSYIPTVSVDLLQQHETPSNGTGDVLENVRVAARVCKAFDHVGVRQIRNDDVASHPVSAVILRAIPSKTSAERATTQR